MADSFARVARRGTGGRPPTRLDDIERWERDYVSWSSARRSCTKCWSVTGVLGILLPLAAFVAAVGADERFQNDAGVETQFALWCGFGALAAGIAYLVLAVVSEHSGDATPLHLAVLFGHTALVKQLRKEHAAIHIKDDYGFDAVALAEGLKAGTARGARRRAKARRDARKAQQKALVARAKDLKRRGKASARGGTPKHLKGGFNHNTRKGAASLPAGMEVEMTTMNPPAAGGQDAGAPAGGGLDLPALAAGDHDAEGADEDAQSEDEDEREPWFAAHCTYRPGVGDAMIKALIGEAAKKSSDSLAERIQTMRDTVTGHKVRRQQTLKQQKKTTRATLAPPDKQQQQQQKDKQEPKTKKTKKGGKETVEAAASKGGETVERKEPARPKPKKNKNKKHKKNKDEAAATKRGNAADGARSRQDDLQTIKGGRRVATPARGNNVAVAGQKAARQTAPVAARTDGVRGLASGSFADDNGPAIVPASKTEPPRPHPPPQQPETKTQTELAAPAAPVARRDAVRGLVSGSFHEERKAAAAAAVTVDTDSSGDDEAACVGFKFYRAHV